MTGRDLYEKWCHLKGHLSEGRPKDFTRLELDVQLAWDDLAAWINTKLEKGSKS